VDLRGAPRTRDDITAPRAHTEILPLFTVWADEHLRVLGDLGYEGEQDTITVAFKKPQGGELSDSQRPSTRSTTASGLSVNAATPC
jgi:hypothetical protein